MDEQDAAICRTVWVGWTMGMAVRPRQVALALGWPHNYVFRRLGRDIANPREPNLASAGWLAVEEGDGHWMLHGTLRPGPRFVGLDHGWPLEGASYE